MAVQINWALDRTPDFSQNALASFQAGQQLGKEQATRNALAKYGSDPQGAITSLMSVDPVAASQLRQGYQADQTYQRQQTFRTALAKGDLQGANAAAAGDPQLMQAMDQMHARMKALNDAQAAGLQAVAGLPPEQRAQVWDKDVAPRLVALGMDPSKVSSQGGQIDFSDNGIKAAAAQTMSAKDQLDLTMKQAGQVETTRHNQATEGQAAAQLQETGRHNRSEEGLTGQRNRLEAQQLAAQGWQVLTDPKTNEQYRFNARTGQATTLDGSQAYAPQGAAKIAGGTPRSAVAMAVQRYLEQNPNASAEDLAQFNSHLRAQAKASSDFATGSQGKTINSLNVGVQHLDTLQQAADALNNGNIQAFNRIGQDIKAQFGSPAPTNFDTTKQIVAGEIVKAITGAGGGVADREHAQAIINRANSPAQLAGSIAQVKKLFAGQLQGLRAQYHATTGLNDFEDRLLPATRAELEGADTGGGHATPANRPSLDQIFGGH